MQPPPSKKVLLHIRKGENRLNSGCTHFDINITHGVATHTAWVYTIKVLVMGLMALVLNFFLIFISPNNSYGNDIIRTENEINNNSVLI